LDEEEYTEMFKLLQVSIRVIREAYKPDGFNVGFNIGRVAGAGYDGHIHLHVVPRWNGDTNFMPIIGDVKVVSEGIDETYKRLRPLFLKELL
jgi:ATP adenylyltransferase